MADSQDDFLNIKVNLRQGDLEIATMYCLHQVMEHMVDRIDKDAAARVAAWFYSKYTT